MKQENPMAKYQLQSYGSKRRNTEGMFENRGGNAARDERRAAKRDQQPMTFADMQATGVARPAPSAGLQMFTGPQAGLIEDEGNVPYSPYSPPSVPSSTPSAPSGAVPTTQTYTPGNIPAAPASQPSGSGTYDARRAAMLANLQASFAGQRQGLDEEMARRGLYSSSIASGRMGDLAGQQARAMATLEGDLMNEEQNREIELYRILAQLAPYFVQGGV